MKTFEKYLAEKEITADAYKEKPVEEQASLHKEWQEALSTEIDEAIKAKVSKEDVNAMIKEATKGLENYSTKEDITKLEGILKEQGETITSLKNKGAEGDKLPTIAKQLADNKEVLQKILNREGNESIVIKADTLRTSIASNTQSFNLPDIGQLAHRKLTMYDLFPKFPVSESNTNGVIRYWDWDSATIARAAATRAEGAAFPESTAKWVLGTIPLEKIGDSLPVSEEFEADEAMFAAELGMFLETNVSLELDTQLASGNGTTPNLKGLVTTVSAFTPAASGITDANIYDLLVKVSESITTTGGSKYSPDFAVMHISDINEMKLKKDGNNNYIIPPFVSRDGTNVSGITVIESNVITTNTMVLGDRRYARIYEKGGIELSRGMVNAQFTEDMSTIKARKRAAFLIRGADLGGFLKVTSISAALTTLAT